MFRDTVHPPALVLRANYPYRLFQKRGNHMKLLIALSIALVASIAVAQTPDTVFLEELTWTEVRDKLEAGTNTIIVATAGTEQNGPHMVLGKHRFIIRATSELIARELGNTLVSPVITHVPEGGIDPPTGHMRFPGTISLPNAYFTKVVEYTARSHRASGFTNIVFIGDSGGNQGGMKEVADALNEEWRGSPARIFFIPDYYSANGFREWLVAQGESDESIGRHAGIHDTSELLAVAPGHIRLDARQPGGGFQGSGVSGDPTRASAEYGKKGIALKVETAVRQLRSMMAEAEAARLE
jgi:creatinine amidohydrolase/Fe(II)-dependent formamide hydrolase-like protein